MKQTLTLTCKLQPVLEQAPKIEVTLQAFADACNWANEQVPSKITSKRTIQTEVYHDLRARFGLSANLAVRACARLGANRKAAKAKGQKVKAFKPTSVDYDARIFAYREKDNTVSLTLIDGREHIPLQLGNYQLGKLKGRKPTAATLCKHQDGQYYIHIQLSDERPDPAQHSNVIGADFGRRDIAHTSEGDSWSGEQIQQVRDRFARTRASLQSKGTRSAKRCLKRLSGREKRFQAWLNHNISRKIINRAMQTNSAVAIEDLTGIRERTNQKPRNKAERRRSNSWAFYQLRQFLAYKAIKDGVNLVLVNPAYTSQTCHNCLHIGVRTTKKFKCGHCGWHGDADLNGSLVIKLLGQSVTLPEVSALACSISKSDAKPAFYASA